MLLAKKKKSLRKFFDFTVPGGGFHPDLNFKVRAQCALFVPWSARLLMLAWSELHVEHFYLRRRHHQPTHSREGRIFIQRHSLRNGIAFIPSSHLLHLSQFNRSKIWASLEKLPAPPNKNNVRILQTSVGAFLCLPRAARSKLIIPPQLLGEV
jgi:hypothetical protein